MPESLTELLTRLRKVCEAATPGPWRIEDSVIVTDLAEDSDGIYDEKEIKIFSEGLLGYHEVQNNKRFAAQARAILAPALDCVAALEQMLELAGEHECYACGHKYERHLDKYGCEYEGPGDECRPPCGCKGISPAGTENITTEIEQLRSAKAALAAFRKAGER